jgi:hypothetical protein
MSSRDSLDRLQPSDDDPEAIDLWEVEEKLNHVRRILAISPGSDENGDEESLQTTVPRAASVMNKLGIVALSCSSILLAWSLFGSRQDLVAAGLSIGTLGMLAWFAAWCFSQSGRLPLRSSRGVS